MRTLLGIIAIALLAYFAPFVGPWYLIAIAGLIGGMIIRKPTLAFLLAFLVVAILWYVQLHITVSASSSDLPDRMGKLIGAGNGGALMVVTANIGGLVAGFAAAAGATLTRRKKKRRRF